MKTNSRKLLVIGGKEMKINTIEKCEICGGLIQNIALTSNPPIYKKICENCGEIEPKIQSISCGLCSFSNCGECCTKKNLKINRR